MNHLPVVWMLAMMATVAPGAASSRAQQAAEPSAAPASEKAAESPAGVWATRCVSKTRAEAVECSVEQSLVKSDTRQLVALFSVRLPAATRSPVAMIQLPLGLFLPAGLDLQVDEGDTVKLQVQTCDAAGCYAGTPMSTELVDRLKRGKTLHLRFENLARAKVSVALQLAGFAEAFEAVR